MKIAYISTPHFSDVDLSYLSTAQKYLDITYYMWVHPRSIRKAAVNIQTVYPKSGVFSASIYPELNAFGKLVDKAKFFIINRVAKRSFSLVNLWTSVKLLWKLRKFDVIHITFIPHYFDFGLYLFRKKLVLTVHDPIPHSSTEHTSLPVTRYRNFAMKHIDNFVILNQAQRQEFIDLYQLQHKNVWNSSLGVYDYLKMHTNASTSNEQYILFFGQIFSYKGLDYLFPAMEQVHEKYPDVKLVVAGSGKYYFDIAKYQELEYFDIQNRFIPENELAVLIQNALFIACPYTDATQSGVIMSAYAFNKPVLATNVGGLPEMVIDGKYGNIVPARDIDALVKGIDEMLSDKKQLEQYAENIDKYYAQGEKSWEQITNGLSETYEIIASNKK